MNWKQSTNVVKVKRFLGLASYYRRFFLGHSKIALPLMKLTRKKVKFVWINNCRQSFQELKIKLTLVPTLTLPSSTKGLIIYSNGSR